jgi:hypothetical protein
MKKNTLQEIANWKLEARLENHDQYFYKTPEFNKIEDGSRCYVIGRKGSGKTAISNYLIKKCEYNKFSEGISFQNFPFNDLYSSSDSNYTSPNQYITLWKFIIYSTILKMMRHNNNLTPEFKSILSNLFPEGIEESLSRRVKDWTNRKFGIKGFGFGADYSKSITVLDNLTPWVDRVDILENLILNYIDNSRYYLLFDELDDDYKNIQNHGIREQYFALLTSLFKAVQSVKSSFSTTNCNVFPVIFLRSDIYEKIYDSDKNKWTDLEVNLEWGLGKLKQLIGYRISKAINTKEDKTLHFIEAWNRISTAINLSHGGKSYKSIHFIWLLTLNRPRDIISFLKICCDYAGSVENKSKFNQQNILRSESKFSQYLKAEIRDELQAELPEITKIFEVFSALKKQTFNKYDFVKFYDHAIKLNKIPERNPELLLEKLFEYSLIGNLSRSSMNRYFRYKDKGYKFLIDDPICIHRGLYKSLFLD